MSVSAKVIAHSKSSVNGKEIITFELEFPRLILAEFNTHNALSKNASSSRAIPVSKMLEQVRNNPAMPIRFGAANKGMQDAGEHDSIVLVQDKQYGHWEPKTPQEAWKQAAKDAAKVAEQFHNAGYAKQICNRLVEPFQMMKVVMTATELNNFIWLRDHPAADPTIEALAKAIKKAKEESEPVVLRPGDWHTPYYGDGYWMDSGYGGVDGEPLFNKRDMHSTLKNALLISSSCCAQVSFRSLDDSQEKAESVSANLNLKGEQPDEPVHASPTEHQASPMEYTSFCDIENGWEQGVTHMDRDGNMWSGNLMSFVQYRQLIPNNVKKG